MSKVKIAVIGCGNIAKSAHIPAYIANTECEIKYFCDIIPERADAMVEQYKVGTAIYDYNIALNDPEIEGVSVCVPNFGHKVISIAALKAGKNVLCEKPAARIYSEALDMQRVQHETGKTLNIGVVNRFNTGVNVIKDMIDAGELGEIYQVYASFRAHRSIPGLGGDFTNKDVAGGGALIDWGVHFLDIVMYCCGDPLPLTASGKAHSVLGVDMKDYAYTSMWAGPPKYDGVYNVDDFITGIVRTEGPTITLNGAWAQNIGVGEMYIDFMGTKAGIRLQYGADFKMYTYRNGKLFEIASSYEEKPMFQTEIDAFVKCIRSGEKLQSHIDTVVITSKIMQGLYDSSDKNAEVDLTSYPVL